MQVPGEPDIVVRLVALFLEDTAGKLRELREFARVRAALLKRTGEVTERPHPTLSRRERAG